MRLFIQDGHESTEQSKGQPVSEAVRSWTRFPSEPLFLHLRRGGSDSRLLG